MLDGKIKMAWYWLRIHLSLPWMDGHQEGRRDQGQAVAPRKSGTGLGNVPGAPTAQTTGVPTTSSQQSAVSSQQSAVSSQQSAVSSQQSAVSSQQSAVSSQQ
ncbi:hypothetical protein [Aeromonas veronii]|uniref:hypothetical protein n=1 Tax=Aeromonas veronii TaxID=654 RepID=UPI0032EE701A